MNCEKCGLLIGHGTMGTVTPLCQCGWSSKSELKRFCVQDPIGMAEQLAEYKQRAEAAESKLREFEWQPIETAPRRGTAIDIWSPTYGRLVNYRRVSLGRGNVFYDPVDSGVLCIRDATHWMPLPAKPFPAPKQEGK